MKSLIFRSGIGLVFLSALAVSFTGCDLFDKVDDVSFNEEIEVTWTIDENGTGQNVPYTHEETFDLESNAEIKKYIHKIKDVKVEKVTYRITNYDAAPHNSQVFFNSGVASFSTMGSTTPVVSVPFAATASGVNLQTTTSDTQLTIDGPGLNSLAAVLKQEKKAKMRATGTLSQTPVSFKVVSTIHVKITAEAL
jgi:hypothetical protein